MAQVIIRNLSEDVVVRLKRKAGLHGRSLEQELREIVTRAARLSPKEKLALSRRIRAMTPGGRVLSDSAELIRVDRDHR